jgi:Tol biopolymer transport system component
MNPLRRLVILGVIIAALALSGCGAVAQFQSPCPAYSDVSAPGWLPDGAHIYYTIEDANYNSAVFQTNVSTGKTTKLGDVPPYTGLYWSPDMSHVVGGYGDISDFEFYFFDFDAINHTLVNEITYSPDSVHWSPDGERIAVTFHTWTDLIVLDLEGLVVWRLSDKFPALRASGVRWSPDGEYLGFIPHDDVDHTEYFATIDRDGKNIQLLLLNKEFVDDFDWSPNGQWITFISTNDSGFVLNIMRPDGADIRELATDNARSYRWLPDSSGIIYAVDNWEVKSVSIDGVSQTIRPSISPEPDYGAFVFSPDATKVAYMLRGKQGRYDIFVMNIDGTDAQQITHNPGNTMCFNWPF